MMPFPAYVIFFPIYQADGPYSACIALFIWQTSASSFFLPSFHVLCMNGIIGDTVSHFEVLQLLLS